MTDPNIPYIERVADPDSPGNQIAEICIEISDWQVLIHSNIEVEHTVMTLPQARRYQDALLRATEAGIHYQDDLRDVAT